jgi:ABC-type Fe3+-hydroxamate transport system substrate-binding protein
MFAVRCPSSGTRVLLAALLAISVPGLAAREPPAEPARIVSLVPAATEMLFALGAGSRVVGVSSFDRFPPEAARLPRVGALLDPDVERILGLRPDLVVIYRSQADLARQLARAGVPVYPYAHAGLRDVPSTLRDIGARVGRAGSADALAAEIAARLDAVRARVRGRAHPRTLVVMGRDPLSLRGIYASGGIGFVHDMLEAAGGTNVFADVRQEAVQATAELIIARRPEVILELRADAIDEQVKSRELQVWETLASVPAVRRHHVRILADARTIIPGPRVAEGVEVIARELDPAR